MKPKGFSYQPSFARNLILLLGAIGSPLSGALATSGSSSKVPSTFRGRLRMMQTKPTLQVKANS